MGLNYILLGKFQTDDLEHRFGKYRQLAGGQYHISIRQLYESEKRLRIQTLLTLNSKTFGNINIKSFCENWAGDASLGHEFENSFNPDIDIQEHEINNIKQDLPVITYLAGYCCYTTLKHLQCDFCKQNLVYPEEMAVEDNYNLIKNLSRGKLLFPKEFAVQTVCFSYILFNKIISEFEEDFSFICNKRQFLIHFTFQYISKNGYM